jgi:DNA ligase D-like protein (predicted 3'-phosphoesterase)
MASKDELEEYRSKRDFRKTPEPTGDEETTTGEPRFVIQKHDASSLHYDFRLEVDGVLKSWVVPKGPSTDPSVKRLAIPTEDHPLAYATFEGVIPASETSREYGAGTVLVWDTGTYRNLKEDEGEGPLLAEAIDEGKVTVWLDGEKLRGGYALIRTGSGDDTRWLLIKIDDDEADARRNPTSTEPQSVLTGRTLEEIAEEEGT